MNHLAAQTIENPSCLSPEHRRLLHNRHFGARPDLPLSDWQRCREMERVREARAFRERYPWFEKLDPSVRQMLRQMLLGLEKREGDGRGEELWRVVDAISRTAGSDVVEPLILHLYGGKALEVEGQRLAAAWCNEPHGEDLILFLEGCQPKSCQVPEGIRWQDALRLLVEFGRRLERRQEEVERPDLKTPINA